MITDIQRKKILGVGLRIGRLLGLSGIGIREIGNFNRSLLAKWKWRLVTEKQRQWKEVFESKYKSWKDIKMQNSTKKELWWWKNICSIYGVGAIDNWFDNSVS